MNKLLSITILVTLVISACSDEGKNHEEQEHVWKDQTEALDKAKAVEGIIQDSARAQEQQIQEDTK